MVCNPLVLGSSNEPARLDRPRRWGMMLSGLERWDESQLGSAALLGDNSVLNCQNTPPARCEIDRFVPDGMLFGVAESIDSVQGFHGPAIR